MALKYRRISRLFYVFPWCITPIGCLRPRRRLDSWITSTGFVCWACGGWCWAMFINSEEVSSVSWGSDAFSITDKTIQIYYCIVPRCSGTVWTHPEIIPVGHFFRRWIKSINQSSLDFHCKPFDWLIDWLIDDKLTLNWLVYWIRTARSVVLRGRG